MDTLKHNIDIELTKSNNRIDYFKIKKNDSKSHEFIINLYNNSVAFNLSNTTAKIHFRKADKNAVFQDCTIADVNGKLSCILETQTISYPGIVEAEVSVYGPALEVLTSITFEFLVVNTVRDDSEIESTSSFSALVTALAQVTDFTNFKNELIAGRKGEASLEAKMNKIDEDLAEIPYQLKATDNLQTILDSGYRVIKLNPKNTYTFGSTALPSNTTIIGNNATITHNSANGSLFTCYGTSQANKINITIKDLIIVGIGDRVDTTRSVAIDCEYVKNVSLVNCEVNSFNVASRFNNCDNVLVKDNYLHDIKETSDTIHGYGVLLENSTNVKIINNQCDNIDRHTFYLNMGYNVFISGNIVNSPQAMVSSTVEIPIKLTTIKKVVITNNILRYGLGGIYFVPDLTSNDPLTGAEDVLIANNVFEDRIVNSGFATGYIWSKSASPTNIVIRNNIFRNSTDHCINIEGGLNITISDNEINTSSLSGAVAIRLTAGTGASSPKPIINNNTIRNYTTGISNASGILPIGRNNLFESVTTPISNSNGSDCLILDSQEVGYSRHIITGATPSVALGTVFTTNDAGSTTVTNYLGGTRGQVITIFFVNVNTTVQHGTNIKLKGAVNFASASGKSLTLIKEGAAWYEIGRTE